MTGARPGAGVQAVISLGGFRRIAVPRLRLNALLAYQYDVTLMQGVPALAASHDRRQGGA